MNRNRSEIANMRTKEISQSKQKRSADTRTKIEYGGLVHKSSLPSFLGLELGDVVHDNPENWEKEAVILGVLIEGYKNLLDDTSGEIKEQYKFLGMQSLKYGKTFTT